MEQGGESKCDEVGRSYDVIIKNPTRDGLGQANGTFCNVRSHTLPTKLSSHYAITLRSPLVLAPLDTHDDCSSDSP